MIRLWLVLCVLFFSLPAQAQDVQCKDPSRLDQLDGLFGRFLVGPMATVLFFDLAFWDNTLPMGALPDATTDGPFAGKTMIGDTEVLEFRAGGGEKGEDVYALRSWYTLEPDKALFEVSTRGDRAELSGSITSAAIAKAGGCSKPLSSIEGITRQGAAVMVPTDVGPLMIQDVGDGPALQVLTGLAPFPILARPSKAGDIWTLSPAVIEFAQRAGDKILMHSADETLSGDALANRGQLNFPLVVTWLVCGALFFTLRMRFINLRGFRHAIDVTAGVYDKDDDTGEVSHFQALASALSATVGLGNIAGVAIAVSVGGPGAIFWMIMAGFLGMSSKFTECTLGQMYRTVDKNGAVLGGPMRYLDVGLVEMNLGPAGAALGKVLAVSFALMCIGGSFGGGNMFQANQSYAAIAELVPLLTIGDGLLYGVLLAFAVGLVILGGIKRIGLAAGVIVPIMCGVYVVAALWILTVNAAQVPAALTTIVSEAFAPTAVQGGFIGVLVQGFRRAAFSNEAGVGSASIAHSAASTEEPVREGIVALLEPFIDTIIVCTMTGLVVVITGAYQQDTGDGVLMTSAAFGSVIDWFPLVLSFAVVSFAFSTMISWSYYGERCATYLFGDGASLPYKIIFLVFVVFGSVFKLGNVLDFSDLMILGMAFPNILGMFFLSGRVKARLDDYWGRYTSGQMTPTSAK